MLRHDFSRSAGSPTAYCARSGCGHTGSCTSGRPNVAGKAPGIPRSAFANDLRCRNVARHPDTTRAPRGHSDNAAESRERRNVAVKIGRTVDPFRRPWTVRRGFVETTHSWHWLPAGAVAMQAAELNQLQSSYGKERTGSRRASIRALRDPGKTSDIYKERRKFNTSCICERLSELNLRTTALASDPQLWLPERLRSAGGAIVEAWA